MDMNMMQQTRPAGLETGQAAQTVQSTGTQGSLLPGNLGFTVQGGGVIGTEQVEQARQTLNKYKEGKYVAIVHPYVAYDLMQDKDWKYPHQYAAPENIFNGEIGEIAGVRFLESSEAKIYTGGVFGTLIFGDGAYGVTEVTGGGLQTIIKQKGSAGTADPLDQRSSVGWKAMRTAEILIPQYLVRVESKSAAFSATATEN